MSNAIKLYGKMLSFSRIKITTGDLDQIKAELQQLSTQLGDDHIPALLDCQISLDLSALVELLWSYKICPIGIISGDMNDQATQLRLAIFPADGKRIAKIDADKTPDAAQEPANTETVISSAMSSAVYSQMLRSGQSLQHSGGDLTIIGGVNDGAEAITDNSLHIYGRGLGRLVAGATGDKNARIFCQKFNPSLVSVAGTYCLRDEIDSQFIDQAVQVSYDEQNGLVFTRLDD